MNYLFCIVLALLATSAAPKVIFEINKLPGDVHMDDSFKIEQEKIKKSDDYRIDDTEPCPKDWIHSKELGNCYHILHNVDFSMANEACGNELLSIHSEAENQFILELIHKDSTKFSDFHALILGAKRVNGSFVWLDGTPFDYEIWAGSEPNNWKPPVYGDELPRAENEDCVAMYTEEIDWGNGLSPPKPYLGRWNDNICSGTYSFAICKKAAENL